MGPPFRNCQSRIGRSKSSRSSFTTCRKTLIFVIPRRAARRGISLFLRSNRREIPHFVRNDKKLLFSHPHEVCSTNGSWLSPLLDPRYARRSRILPGRAG